MSEVIQNGDAAAAAAAHATSANTLFFRGVLAWGAMFACGLLATKFMLEATRAATLEAAEIAKLQA